ncbi:MAG: haloacid dehalogenase [Chloroflexi bacterium]|nr:haloacid dehalogenase [Chloroflexota bacterium]
MANLEDIAEQIRASLDDKYQAREKGLALSRSIIRDSANAIRAVHRGELSRAEELLQKAGEAVRNVDASLSGHPDIYFAGFVFDAQKEFAEASITYALIAGHSLPGPDSIGVSHVPYLGGLGEAIGELRRYLLDRLRQGDVARCEDVLQVMDDIYGVLVTMDYPDGMTGGLRRVTDVARGILEKTRGDLTVAIRQAQLETSLHEFEKKLASGRAPGEKP